MAALLTVTPGSPVAGSGASAVASGGGSHMNRLLLDGTLIASICTDDAFTQGFDVPTATGSHTLEWEQLIAGVWTLADDITFDVVDAPASAGQQVVTTNSQTIEDVTIEGSLPSALWTSSQGFLIDGHGSATGSRITNLTIRRCTLRGLTFGVYLKFVSGFLIEDCLIEDVDYAGIATFSCDSGIIRRNIIRRIGYVKNPSIGFQGNNTYGIMTNRSESGSLVTDPVSDDIEVYENTIDWVPLWMGINGHGTTNFNVHDNQTSHSPRGIFVAGTVSPSAQASNVNIDNNTVLASVTKSGGSPDQSGIKLLSASAGTNTVTGNTIGSSYANASVETTGSTGTFTPNTVVTG